MIQVGSPAPEFDLPDQDGKSVTLTSLRGSWVVLYFYPKDDTPGCTVEACEFTAALPAFGKLDAQVFGCSADSAAAHTRFVAKYKLGIRLLTDSGRDVMKAYGAYGKKVLYGKETIGVIRSTVLIAPDGTIAHHWRSVKAQGHAEYVAARLRELRGGGGEVTAKTVAKTAKKTAKKATKKITTKTTKTVAKKAAKKSSR